MSSSPVGEREAPIAFGAGPRAEVRTVVSSDLVGSTKLAEQLGDRRAAELWQRHDQAARALLAGYGGREIDKSDGFLLLFDRPISAIAFALGYHDALAALGAETGVPLAARVGIHLGEVSLRANAPADVARGAKPLEVEGFAKSVAARLQSLAAGGQTLLTRAAYDLARRAAVDGLPGRDDLEWRAHGEYVLAGADDAVEVFEVGVPGKAPLAAPADTEKARRRARDDRAGVLVLPFADLSPGADSEYIAVGLTDEIISSLSTFPSLRVISRTSAMQLKGTAKTLPVLAAELNVRYVVEGSVKRAGDALRITFQLARADQDRMLWSRKYGGRVDDLFEVEEAISRSVAEALELRLTESDVQRLEERPIPNLQAYEYYLRAKQHIYAFTKEALDTALEYLQKGAAIIGDNVPITAAMGYVYWQYYNIGISADPAYLENARACAERLFAMQPGSPDGHRLLGLVGVHTKDIQRAVWHLRIALKANPNDTDVLFWLPLCYGLQGRAALGRPLVERLLEIDPLTPLHHAVPGFLALLEGDFARAAAVLAPLHREDPDNPIVAFAYGQTLAMAGRAEEAGAVFAGMEERAPETFFTALGHALRLALAGDHEGALAALPAELREAAGSDPQYAWTIAQPLALAGATDDAIDMLATAVRRGFLNLPMLAEHDVLLAGVRETPRFRALLDEVRSAHSALEP